MRSIHLFRLYQEFRLHPFFQFSLCLPFNYGRFVIIHICTMRTFTEVLATPQHKIVVNKLDKVYMLLIFRFQYMLILF